MLFNLIVLTLILLITMYLATQGMLSALIALATATFASILAMGLLEPLQGLVAGIRPDFARGVTLLLTFFLAFSGTRIAADMIVPNNIKLPLLVNRIAGGIAGFFCAMVVVGTMIVGVEMMPLNETLIGFDRFPSGMKGDTTGTAAKPENVWLSPDRFVLALWNGASGRGLGGSRPWSQIHPDMATESYGYRHTVQLASRHTLYPELLEVKDGWTAIDPSKIKKFDNLPSESGKRFVMIRTAIKKAVGKDHTSADPDDEWFRITPNEVRLIAHTTGRDPIYDQYYPVGVLRMRRAANNKGDVNPKVGTYFYQPFDLEKGQLVDDYAQVDGDSAVVYDWVFCIPDDQAPEQIEVKELARAPVAGLVKDLDAEKDTVKAAAMMAPMKPENYPLRVYETQVTNYTVTMTSEDKLIPQGKVYLLDTMIPKSKLESALNTATGKVETLVSQVNNGSGGWDQSMQNLIHVEYNLAVRIQPDKEVSPSIIVPLLITAQMKADPRQTMQIVPNYIKNELEPLLAGSIYASAEVKDGVAKLEKVPSRKFTAVAWGRTDKGFYLWINDVVLGKEEKKDKVTAENSPIIKVEINK